MPVAPIVLREIPREGALFTLRGSGLVGDGWAIVCPERDCLAAILPQVNVSVSLRPNGSTENDSAVTLPLIVGTAKLQDLYLPAGTVLLCRNAGGDPVLVTLRVPPLTDVDLRAGNV